MKKMLILALVSLMLVGCGKTEEINDVQEEIQQDETITFENENVDQPDISTYPLMYALSDWYDEAGNLVWSAITPDELNKMSAEQKKNFISWWEEYNESDYDTESDEELEISGNIPPRDRINLLCREYNNLIPFAVDGREYGLGYEKYYDGFDNRGWEKEYGTTFGLDGEGYLIWLYRNTFGYTPTAMEDGLSEMINKEDVQSVELADLKIGDICMVTNDPSASYNQYGIVAGEYEGHIVVSLCDNVSTPKFSAGANRLAYIVGEHNVAIGESMPVDFRYFYRITSLKWGDK